MRSVSLVSLPSPDELPALIDPATQSLDALRPQLAIRAHAAWNARAALTRATLPTLLVGDFFGGGVPGDLFGVRATAADFAQDLPADFHGWLVLGLAAATFDPVGGQLAADRATGLFPGSGLPLRVVDLTRAIGKSALEDRLVELVRTTPGHVVLNTSLASGCSLRPPAGCTAAEAAGDAVKWIARVRGQGVEGKFLQVVSAGNIDPATPAGTDARLNSDWNAAALLPLTGLANLSNTIVVENVVASPSSDQPYHAVCLAATSKRGGHLSAVGNDVSSLQSPTEGLFLDDGGTSSATPQVAGLAAYLWALDPRLTPQEVAAKLRSTARAVTVSGGDDRCGPGSPAPAVDAYAALLSADSPLLLPGLAPARAAILDVADSAGEEGTNRAFDERDLARFTGAFDAQAGSIDYGRYDLNGDGHTGGSSTDQLDLDATAATNEELTIETLPIRFDESALTDPQILCFYAFSPLYGGDPAIRDQFAREHCLPKVDLQVAFPRVLVPGAATPLTARTNRLDFPATGQTVAQPGVRLELSVTGGTVGDVTGTTGPNGEFATNATLLAPATTLTIHIVARAGTGGPILAEATVQASAGVQGSVAFGGSFRQISTQATALAAGTRADGAIVTFIDRNSFDKAFFGPGRFSETPPAVPASVTTDLQSASATASVRQTSDVQAGARTLTVTASGGGSITATASGAKCGPFVALRDHACGHGGSVSRFTFSFEVSGAPVHFSLSGSATEAGGDPDNEVHVLLRGSTPLVDFSTLSGGSPASSGELAPGSYLFVVISNLTTDAAVGGTSSSFDLTLTVGS